MTSAVLPVLRILCVAWVLSLPGAAAAQSPAVLRRPVALAASADSRWLYVANRDSGSISIIDLARREVAGEHKVGQRLSDLVCVPGSQRLLALDEGQHELVVLAARGQEVEVTQRLAVSPYPVSILAAPGGREATICSLWSRRLTFVALGPVAVEPAASITRVLDLPFAPRAQVHLPDHQRLLVADAFGGKLALVDPAKHAVAEWREIPGHNIRGLGITAGGQMLLVSHQMLNDLAHSIRNDIHWGLLMTNDLRWLKIDSVIAGGEQFYRGAHMHPLGDAGRGGGDPGPLDVAADGTVVVSISGVSEIAFGQESNFSMQRRKAGRRPTAVRIAPDGKTAFIANTFDDSISLLDMSQKEIAATISLGSSPDLSLAQQGELLFYDARLSHDGWMSCHSCHTDGHANGQMNDNFSDRSFGAAKRVLSLLGVKDTLPLAWNGQIASLAEQIHNSVEKTMQREDPLANEDTAALAAYLQTLEVPPPVDKLRGALEEGAVKRGRAVFVERNCGACHAPPAYTSPGVFDVGLRDSQGNTKFNPPSLRGISHRDAFFHDNSAATLKDVFVQHAHPSGASYSAGEAADLIAFLRSL